mmetsp:Transcript_142086/g.258249  ORF Transcript_142086/g.258249 Transcript_142086/m.258249 type:complete len:204 (+) Transcript_142086:110-721(+)
MGARSCKCWNGREGILEFDQPANDNDLKPVPDPVAPAAARHLESGSPELAEKSDIPDIPMQNSFDKRARRRDELMEKTTPRKSQSPAPEKSQSAVQESFDERASPRDELRTQDELLSTPRKSPSSLWGSPVPRGFDDRARQRDELLRSPRTSRSPVPQEGHSSWFDERARKRDELRSKLLVGTLRGPKDGQSSAAGLDDSRWI